MTYLVCSCKHWLDVCPKSKTSPKTWWFINTYAVPNIRRQRFIDHSCLFCSSPHAFKKLEQFGGRHVAQAKNVLFSSFVGSGATLWWEQSSNIVVSLQIALSNGMVYLCIFAVQPSPVRANARHCKGSAPCPVTTETIVQLKQTYPPLNLELHTKQIKKRGRNVSIGVIL